MSYRLAGGCIACKNMQIGPTNPCFSGLNDLVIDSLMIYGDKPASLRALG
jgi:hypothetical protein